MLEPMDVAPTQTDIPATATLSLRRKPRCPPTPTEASCFRGRAARLIVRLAALHQRRSRLRIRYPHWLDDQRDRRGPRGTQIQFLSKPELADAAVIPEGETRVNATIYLWDPKNDLAAYVEHRRTAWEASGFTILEEEQLTLELGLPAVLFTIQTSETQFVVLLAALRDSYLEINGEGDLELVKESRCVSARYRNKFISHGLHEFSRIVFSKSVSISEIRGCVLGVFLCDS